MNLWNNVRYDLRKIKYILSQKQKKRTLLTFMVMLGGAVWEMLGVSLILPFAQAIIAADELLEKNSIRKISSFFHIKDGMELLFFFGMVLILVYIAKNIYLSFSAYIQTKFAVDVQKELSVKMMETYMKRPYGFFLNINTSEIYQVIGSDTYGVYAFLSEIFRVLTEVITISLIGIFIFVTDFVMAFTMLALAATCLIIINLIFREKMKEGGKAQRKYNAIVGKHLHQAFFGIKEVLVMQKQSYFVKEYETAMEKKIETQLGQAMGGRLPSYVIEAICISGFLGFICFRIKMGINVASFIPKFAAFAVAAFRILPSVSRITSSINQMTFVRPSINSVYKNLKEIETYESENRKDGKLLANETVNYGGTYEQEYILNIENVYFKYENTDKNVLEDLSLQIRPNTSVAFIGSSGAGKTTLADIILGLLMPQSGKVETAGGSIYADLGKWSQMIGYVPQSIYLIDDTIRSNVAFGVEEIEDEKVKEALRQAQLWEFVEKLPGGICSRVGERGVRLSGGQRQRIAIARALYHKPSILVFDEATSALDHETETAVMKSIEALQGKKTILIVAHRLSTIRNCDEIYEIAGGKAIKRKHEDVFSAN